MAHKALLHSFYSKLAVALIISFVLIGLLLVLFIQQLGHNYQSEVEQKLHLNLASHLVDSKSILTGGEIDNSALKDTFHTMMILGPSFEFYLLDTEGNILTYDAEPGKIKREQVDLSPIHAFLNNSETLPIWGDDPRHDHRKKIFSVTEITNEQGLQGYLYIIIGGELYDGVVDLMKNSHIATLGLWLMGAAILFSMLVTLLLFGFLTRPLRKLSQEMTLFSQKGFEKVDLISQNSAHWNPDSPDEIERLGANFHKMADALGQQYEHIKSTDELRRELISYVSHDLRTPLASLQGYLETWQLNHQNMDQAASASLIDIALKSSQQVSRLVEQLFELAHLDSHTLTLEKEPVVITELAYDVIQSKRMDAEKKGVQLKVNSEYPSAKVSANMERLERVFSNLIDNAIRHCKSGDSVSIDITLEPAGPCTSSLSGRERKSTEPPKYEQVCVHVTDTGSGIPAEDLKFVFNNHFRASNAVKSRHSGSGLGLAITRRILDLHGSQIEVTSELEKGTRFSFALTYIH